MDQELTKDTPTPAQMIAAALVHHQAGRFTEAKNIYMQLLSLEPENFDALHLLGVLAHQSGKHDLAVELIEKAVQQNDQHAVAFNNLGEAYKGLKQLDEAERCYRRALELNPDFAEICSNLGNALRGLGRTEEAAEMYRRALTIRPEFLLVHMSLAGALTELGEWNDAKASYEAALVLNPEFTDASRELARLQLLLGDYQQGVSFFEQGSDSTSASRTERLAQLEGKERWWGEPLEHKRLLLVCEQGGGDNLMMIRYLELLKELRPDGLLIWATPNLARLFAQVDGLEVISMTQAAPMEEFDLYCPMMSLPHLFQTTLDTIPNHVPYLSIPEELQQGLSERLSKAHGIKVGLCFSAGKLSGTSARRSIELTRFLPLLEIDGVQLVNLQKGKEGEKLEDMDWDILDCMGECQDFLDTASLIEQLDLVISVDTSVAHLAGALGKPVWLLNCFESEWRWMLARDDSPWYPSMRIFRQRARGDWDGVVGEVAKELLLFAERYALNGEELPSEDLTLLPG